MKLIVIVLFTFIYNNSFTQNNWVIQLDVFWGYLKYNSVSKNEKTLNWDDYYFQLYPKVVKVNSQDELNFIFKQFIISFDKRGWGKSKKHISQNKLEIRFLTDLDLDIKNYLDFKAHQFGDDRIALASMQSFCKKDLYFPCFENESSYDIDSCKQEKFRSLALAKFWNVIQYFYPNKTYLGFEWEEILEKYVGMFREFSNKENYLILCRNLNTEILDAHAATSIQGSYADLNQFSPPFVLTKTKNVYVVKKSFDEKILIGDTILSIENVPIKDYFLNRITNFKVKNEVCYESILQKMLFTEKKSSEISFKQNGSLIYRYVTNIPVKNILGSNQCTKKYVLTDTTIYINLACFSNEKLEEILKDIPSGIKLIMDLREYPSISFDFLGHFTDTIVKCGTEFYPKKNFPGQFIINREIIITPKVPNYSTKFTKIDVLINKETISKGEYIALGFKELKKINLIGERTSGTMGILSYIELPGKYIAVFTVSSFINKEGDSLYASGVQPNKFIEWNTYKKIYLHNE